MFEWFVFRTRFGDWLLERFELTTGLALVPLDWLGDEQIGLMPVRALGQDASLGWEPSTAAEASIPEQQAFGKAFLAE